jgi:hypothetical protein
MKVGGKAARVEMTDSMRHIVEIVRPKLVFRQSSIDG